MIFDIKVIPHKDQRYDTVGDWLWSKGLHDDEDYLYIKVSKMGDERMEFLCVVHEMVEAVICSIRGISEQQVTAFDIEYEANRKDGDTSEPGNSKAAPYHWPHVIATLVERFVAYFLKVDWKEYGDKINSLEYK